MKTYSREFAVMTLLGVILVLLAIFAPQFFAWQPLLSRLAREAPVLLVACAAALVIIVRQIDISIGSLFGVCSVSAGLLATAGWPLPGVLGASVVIGIVLAGINGILVAGLRLPSIVVTLATMVIWREALRWIRQGEFINLPNGTQWFGQTQTIGQAILILAALGLVIALAWGTRYIAVGRYIYAVGSDVEGARLAGLRPQLTTFAVFTAAGALIGLAALMNVVQSPQVDPKSGFGLELRAIAAAVVGGVAISGGRGTVWGVLAGLLLLACVNPALTYLRVEAYWEKAIQGVIILLAVVSDGWRPQRKISRR